MSCFQDFCAVVSILFVCVACDGGLDKSCKRGIGTRSVTYSGGIMGHGTVTAEEAENGRVRMTLGLKVPDTEEVATVSGIGTCVDGVVRLQLSPPNAEAGELKVLDGSVVSVIAPEPLEIPFGLWEITALYKRDNSQKKFVGFWRAVPENDRDVSPGPTDAPEVSKASQLKALAVEQAEGSPSSAAYGEP